MTNSATSEASRMKNGVNKLELRRDKSDVHVNTETISAAELRPQIPHSKLVASLLAASHLAKISFLTLAFPSSAVMRAFLS
ncbi:hypothetical protein TL16_g02651 [Triparma laevis f. inornata]|uniref:Uncharacterized protein n=1 Tax=Triparma laevis f. inornata TaxID=1714386 RepID=A0A9W7E1H3_9STRA|nr:hypothetical protein TL16_g02651 [Triparma laevis f. inornata]